MARKDTRQRKTKYRWVREAQVILSDGTKLCSFCKQILPIAKFGKHVRMKCGYTSRCRLCTKAPSLNGKSQIITNGQKTCCVCRELQPLSNFFRAKETSSKYSSRCKKCIDQKRTKDWSYSKHLRQLLFLARGRAKKDGSLFDLTQGALEDKFRAQRGLCFYSGIEMTYVVRNGRIRTNISIDRIDSSVGYTISNTVLCCLIANQMKTDLDTNEFVGFCEAIAAHSGKQQEVSFGILH